MILRAPFPWFGGKRRVGSLVWERFGDTANYVEPFAGSLAVLLARPHEPRAETVNDLDCYVANFWRALQADPESVAHHADWPVNEADLHARHQWLVDRDGFRERIKSDPDHFDAKIAGWWVWGISQWIGSGWCRTGTVKSSSIGGAIAPRGVHAKRPTLGKGGHGVHRSRPNLQAGGNGVVRHQLPCLHGDSGATGRGVYASGLEDSKGSIEEWFQALADRLRRVRVCCGNWARIMGPSPTTCIGTTAVLLDPPYASDRDEVYSQDSFTVANQVREWAIAHGDNQQLRIALCGYDGEHAMPDGWDCVAWKAAGGYGSKNSHRERIWFSPHCLRPVRYVQQLIGGQA